VLKKELGKKEKDHSRSEKMWPRARHSLGGAIPVQIRKKRRTERKEKKNCASTPLRVARRTMTLKGGP